MTRPVLYLNFAAEFDWLTALAFGRVDEAQPFENWQSVSPQFGYLHEEPGGRALGFKVVQFSRFDIEAAEVAEIWDDPHFDAPTLGLRNASAGEIVMATRALFGHHRSVNRGLFEAAIECDGPEGLAYWVACLQSGDSTAHLGLGESLHEAGRHKEAYRHLRYYVEIAPMSPWGWCGLGQTCEALGEPSEARAAYARTIELEGDECETPARERYDHLSLELDGQERGSTTG